MAKNILILSSSPRRGGNSDALCDEFSRGALESSNTVEKICLADKKIAYCSACYACRSLGECVQKDDMSGILEKMVAADVIVMATPVYFYSMCAQMKTLIDRTVPRYAEISGKEFYFILTAADSKKRSLERTVEALRGFTSCLDGSKEMGIIYGTSVWEIGDVIGDPILKEAYSMGRKA